MMYPRHRFDIGFDDLAYGLAACVRVHRAEPVEAEALRAGAVAGQGLVAQSVRSAWHLLLSVLAWAPGSEVLVTSITHPDMIKIIHAHRLRAVPVDLDPETLAPSLDELALAVTDRTKALLVVDLFGGRLDLQPLAGFARERGLLLIDDAAQAFTGPASLTAGLADVTMYSFGMIKTSSAGGGAIMLVRDLELLADLRRLQRTWPNQHRLSYAGRLLKIGALLVLGQPAILGLFFGACARLGRDPDQLINAAARSAPEPVGAADTALLDRLRRRPSPALVALLGRRLRRFDEDRLRRRAAVGERVAAALPASAFHPGNGLRDPTHWLFPVRVADPARLVAELRRRGLDASRATSNLRAVPGPGGLTPQSCGGTTAHAPRGVPVAGAPETRASWLMTSIVYLPVYPELPERAVRELLDALARAGG